MSGLGNKEIISKNIRRLMEQNGVSRNDICDALGFSYTTFNDWYNGKTYPRIDKIEMMANFFGVKKSDLVEEYVYEPNTIAAHHDGEDWTPEELEDIEMFKELLRKKREKK